MKGYYNMRIENNVQSANFGRLIITPEAEASIKRCRNTKTLEKLVQAKKAMAGTEYFDIVVGQGLKCKLKSLKEAFFGVFESQKFGSTSEGVNENIIELGEYSISRHSIYKNDEEYGYSIWKTLELGSVEDAEHIDTLVEIAKELDSQAIIQEKRTQKKGTLSENINIQYANKLKQELLK